MKQTWIGIPVVLSIVLLVSAFGDETRAGQTASEVIPVATALDHLTVLEFAAPVTMVAAGSSAFQIERHENKVFIKPLKPGVSTDLFVWTASRRFTYELESPGEVKNMNFVLDSPVLIPKVVSDKNQQTNDQRNEIADMMLTRAFLAAEPINNVGIREADGRVTVRVENVLRSKNMLYIHYSVRNLTPESYRIATPGLYELDTPHRKISLLGAEHTQLNHAAIRQLGKAELRSIPLVHSELQKDGIKPGEEVEGVIAIHEQLEEQTILQLSFSPAGGRQVEAIFVF